MFCSYLRNILNVVLIETPHLINTKKNCFFSRLFVSNLFIWAFNYKIKVTKHKYMKSNKWHYTREKSKGRVSWRRCLWSGDIPWCFYTSLILWGSCRNASLTSSPWDWSPRAWGGSPWCRSDGSPDSWTWSDTESGSESSAVTFPDVQNWETNCPCLL